MWYLGNFAQGLVNLFCYCLIKNSKRIIVLFEFSQLENAANDFVLHVEGVRLALREGTVVIMNIQSHSLL